MSPAKAKSAAEAELLRMYPVGSEIEFTIMPGQVRASSGTVVGLGYSSCYSTGYLRVKHHEAKPRSRYACRDVHHTKILTPSAKSGKA